MKKMTRYWTIALGVLFCLILSYAAAAPVFISPINNQTFNLTQNVTFSYMIAADDSPDNLLRSRNVGLRDGRDPPEKLVLEAVLHEILLRESRL